MSDQPTIQTVIDTLTAEGHLTEDVQERAAEVLAADQTETTWYIQGLMGCGGWIGSIMFFSCASFFFLSTLDLLDETTAGFFMLVLGVVAIGGSIFARRMPSIPFFLEQFLLAFQIAGHLLVLAGMGIVLNFDSIIPIALVAIVLQCVVIPLFPDNIFRFLSTLTIVGALVFILMELDFLVVLPLITAALAFMTFYIWSDLLAYGLQVQYHKIINPVRYAIAFAMFGVLIFEQWHVDYWYYSVFDAPQLPFDPVILSIFTALVLLGLVIWLEMRLLSEFDVPYTSIRAVGIGALTVLIALPALTTPGILAGLLVALLGFRRRNGLLRGFAYAFFAGFIIYFYYSLETTLLIKSFIMMVMGGVLLLSRLALQYLLRNQPIEGGATA